MRIFGRTITEALHNSVRTHLNQHYPHAVLSIETHMFNTIIKAHSCEVDFDVGQELWLNKSRWTKLIRDYLNREHLNRFIGDIQTIYSGDARSGATANMLFNDPIRQPKKHRWGGCLMGATYRGKSEGSGHERPTITFFSRTTYMGYIGFLDAAIANAIIREACIPPSTVSFLWNITSQQVHAFKTLPFIYSQPELMNLLITFTNRKPESYTIPPTWKQIVNWYRRVIKDFDMYGKDMLDKEKYGPFKRIKRRWLEYKGILKKNIPPSLKANELTFEKLEK